MYLPEVTFFVTKSPFTVTCIVTLYVAFPSTLGQPPSDGKQDAAKQSSPLTYPSFSDNTNHALRSADQITHGNACAIAAPKCWTRGQGLSICIDGILAACLHIYMPVHLWPGTTGRERARLNGTRTPAVVLWRWAELTRNEQFSNNWLTRTLCGTCTTPICRWVENERAQIHK